MTSVRGRVWSTKLLPPWRSLGRGVWWRPVTPTLHWHYEVHVNGRVVIADDCGDYDKTQTACRRDVAVFARIDRLGYRLKPGTYRALVDRAKL